MAASIWYTGSADVRTITAADWDELDIAGQDTTTTWDATNGWGILESELDAAAVTWLTGQSEFTSAETDPLLASRPGNGGGELVVQYATKADIAAIDTRLDALENPA